MSALAYLSMLGSAVMVAIKNGPAASSGSNVIEGILCA